MLVISSVGLDETLRDYVYGNCVFIDLRWYVYLLVFTYKQDNQIKSIG